MAADDTTLRAYIALRDEFTPVLKGIEKQSKTYMRQMRNGFGDIADMAKTAGGALGTVAVAGGSVWYATAAAAETAVELDQMSKQTGVAADRLQAWQAAAVASGMDAGEFAESLRDMNIELSDAATGGKDELAQLLKKIGISARDASGNIKTADQVFLEFADAVARQKDSAIQLRMAISAFGEDTGAKLLPLLQQGSKAFRDYEESMHISGMAVSQEQIDSLKDFRKEWESVKFAMSTTSTAVLAELAPSMKTLSEEAQKAFEQIRPLIGAKADEWAKKLSEAIETIPWDTVVRKVDAIISGGDKLKEEFGVVGEVVSFVMENIGTIAGTYLAGKGAKAAFDFGSSIVGIAKSAASLAKVMMPLIGKASPFGILATLVIAVGSAIYENWDKITARTQEFVDGVKKIFNGISDIFTGAIDSIKKGAKKVTVAIESVLPDWIKGDKKETKGILGSVTIGDDDPESVRETVQRVKAAQEEAKKSGFSRDDVEQVRRTTSPSAVSPEEAAQARVAAKPSEEQIRVRDVSLRAPQQTQRVEGAVTVGFTNAPKNLELAGARASKGLSLETTVNYSREGLGIGPYAPAAFGDL